MPPPRLLLVDDEPAIGDFVRAVAEPLGYTVETYTSPVAFKAAFAKDKAEVHVIILDLNMPRKSGRQVIRDIKANSTLSEIPLVVLTTSNQDQDVLDGFNPNRCLYLVKPLSFNALVDLAKQIQNFWLSLTSPKQKP